MSKILVLEPLEQRRQFLKHELEQEGYHVVAPETTSVFDTLESVSPDLLVLELPMPDHDPLATVNRLVERRPRIPILVVSEEESAAGASVRDTADACVMGDKDARRVRATVRQLLNPHAI